MLACQQTRYPGAVPNPPDDHQGRARPPHVGVNVPDAPVGSLLLQVIRAHARVGTELLSDVGVAPPQEIVLLHLDAHGPLPQTDLVHYLGRDRSTVTATLQAMERAGLVTRAPSREDRRAMTVQLTAKGHGTVPRAHAAWRELERRTTAHLTADRRAELLAALALVRDALNEGGG